MKFLVLLGTISFLLITAGFIGLAAIDVQPDKQQVVKTIPNERFFN